MEQGQQLETDVTYAMDSVKDRTMMSGRSSRESGGASARDEVEGKKE